VNILRWGLIPWLKPAKGIEISPYLLFSRVGAVHSGNTDSGGAEESGAGSTGNFADNDWLLVMGADAWYGIGPVSAYAALAWSTGRDRRNLLRPDVEISGLLLHLSAVLRMDWLKFGTSYVHAGGAETDAAGEYLNYGFVSFKGDKLGGMLFRRFYGSNPSAVLDYGGIRIRPYDASRRAGTSAFSLTAAIEDLDLGSFSRSRDKSGLAAVVSAWFYWDTSSSGADFDASLPADVLDQRRLGKYLGYEINLGIAYAFKQAVLEIGFEWGIFIPYDFFLYPVSIAAAPYGNAPLTGFMLFSKMNF
jgi:hypothetical protein